ncbi:MAG: hypothetical protein M3P18_15605 [Actinomycetota bacterium]|nr:hypothetical protein [Actinomycetota bacterium]
MTPSGPSAGWTRSPGDSGTLRELREWAGDIGPIKRIVEVPEEVPAEEPVVIPDPIREPEKVPA